MKSARLCPAESSGVEPQTDPGAGSQKNEAAVAAKRDEIRADVTAHQDDLERGDRVLLVLDACLLLLGDLSRTEFD